MFTLRLGPKHALLEASLGPTKACFPQRRCSLICRAVSPPYCLCGSLPRSIQPARSRDPLQRPLLSSAVEGAGTPVILRESIRTVASSEVGDIDSENSSDLSQGQRENFETLRELLQRIPIEHKPAGPEVRNGRRTRWRDYSEGAMVPGPRSPIDDPSVRDLIERIPALPLAEIALLTQDSSNLVTGAIVEGIFGRLTSQLGHVGTVTELRQILSGLVGLIRSPSFAHMKSSHPDFGSEIAKAFESIREDIPRGTLPTIMLQLSKLGADVIRLDPFPAVCQRIFRNLDQCSEETLGTLAELVNMSRFRADRYASLLLAVFQRRIDGITSPSVFAELSLSVANLSSPQFQDEILRRVKELVHSRPHDFPIGSLENLMRASTSFDLQIRKDIFDTCSVLLLPQVDNMTIPNVVRYLENYKSGSREDATFTAVMRRLEGNICRLTSPQEVAIAADSLSRTQVEGSDRRDIVQKLLDVLGQSSPVELSRMLLVAERLRHDHPELLYAVRRECLQSFHNIRDVGDLGRLTRNLISVGVPKSSIVPLKNKLTQAAYTALAPNEHAWVVAGLMKLERLPSEIDPFLWVQVKKFLPHLTGEASRGLLRMLAVPRFFHSSPVDHPELCSLQREVFERLLQQRPPQHLYLRGTVTSELTHMQPCSDSGQPGNRAAMVNVGNVAGISQYLYVTGYFYQEVVNRVLETAHGSLGLLSTPQLRDIVEALARWGAVHPCLEVINREFAARLIAERREPRALLYGALLLAELQVFPGDLLGRVFDWRFLSTFEDARPDRHLSVMLMKLNRTVCLECPELHVPWFLHEVLPRRGSFAKKEWNRLGKKELHKALSELLGSEQHIKVRERMAYNYTADFVFQYDSQQQDRPPQAGSSSEMVAMDVLPSDAYFQNERTRLNGASAIKKRHLEMLGHRYVHIPEHEWKQHSLRSPSHQVLYLRRKLAGSPATPNNHLDPD